jgi:alkanesulfonate monooxygenase SsuD/methylene tetrahydromethanopterin reductase-like flavin-dependent oxidoreductase (luciferase family)
MKLGVVFPTNEIGNDPSVIRDYAQTAEALGYADLVTYDHVLGAHPDREPKLTGPYTHVHPFHEPLVLFGYLAGLTQRIEMATGILILPQRQTALVAKQAAEVDVLSGGRLRIGVGTGWNVVEYESLNEEWKTRTRRGFAEVAWERAARIGDGVILAWGVKNCLPALEVTRRVLEEGGRDPASFGTQMQVQYSKGEEHWAKEVAAWREAGGSHMAVTTMLAGLEKPADHIQAIRRFKEIADAA